MPTRTVLKVSGTADIFATRQILKASGDTTALVLPQRTVLKVSGATVYAPRVAPITARADVEPGTALTAAAALLGGGTADSWSWTQTSGPAVTLAGSGASRTFTAPSVMPGQNGTVVLAVTATKDGVTSPPQLASFAVLPQTRWFWDGAWNGQPAPVLL